MDVLHEGSRFYMATPGGEAELLYKTNGFVMSIYHTFVPESERGKGIAELLAFAAFDFAKKNKMKVKPDCPYIAKFLERHSELKAYSV